MAFTVATLNTSPSWTNVTLSSTNPTWTDVALSTTNPTWANVTLSSTNPTWVNVVLDTSTTWVLPGSWGDITLTAWEDETRNWKQIGLLGKDSD
jgi:hypothetical protein